jgi:hypothetical protein
MHYTVPMAEYKRPNGFLEVIDLPIDCVDEDEINKVREKLDLMHKHNITITGEIMGTMCNVCLDDGEFDYKFELFSKEGFQDKVKKLVLDFDEADYVLAKEVHLQGEAAAEHGS